MYPNLDAEMARYKVTPADLAKTLKTCVKTIRNKLNGITEITIPEGQKIKNKHFPKLTLDYLFGQEALEKSA